jgi:hypothetical protein
MVMRVGDLKLMVDGIQRKLAAVSTMMHVHSSREVEALLGTLNSKFCQSVELQGQNSRSVISLHLLQVVRCGAALVHAACRTPQWCCRLYLAARHYYVLHVVRCCRCLWRRSSPSL